MRKILTQAQKTFTDLYDSYVLNLSSDIVAVPCDHEGKTTENCTANITYSVNVGTQTLTATCQALSEIENVDCSITSGQITITVPQEVQLADDASMGFRFTTTDSNQFTFDRYITFIKMQKGANGENARSFQIKSEQGDTFNEGIDSITMTAVAFDGATEITDATYTWFYYVSGNGWVQILDNSNGTEDEAQAIPFTQPSLTVYRTATYANSVFRCVITYADGEHDEDYYQLKTAHYNYESVVKFFGGTSTISASSDPFVIAYVDLYKDFQKEETVEADYYYYHENNIKTSSGIDIYTKGIDSTYNTDGNLIYAIYKDETVSPSDTPDSYTISASASPLEYGEVTGGGTYEYGSNIILTATPKSGYIFDKWLDNNSTDATRNITVTQGASYTASFSVHKSTSYTITAKSNDSDHGSGYVNGKTGSQTCDAGSVVTLSAYANVGYVFDDWYENGIAKHWPQSINITTTSNRTFIAHFRKVNVTESMADIDDIDVGENKNIYIYKNDKTYLLFQPTTSGTYRFHCEDKSEMNTYLYNSDMELLATDTGYEFEIIYSFIAHQMYYFAVDINEYEYNSNSVDVYLEDTGASGQYAINLTMSAGGSSVTGAGLYEAGTMVLITATAKNGYEFIRWESSYGETLSTTSSYSFQVNYDMSLTAIFQPIANSGEETSSYGINVSIYPNELCGTVTGTGIYEAGNSVTLSATANSGYEFQGWYINNNGALEGVSNSSTYTFQATQTITYLAVFQDKHHEITVEWFGNGAVYIEGQSDGNGITESLNTKSGNFKENSVIRIVAVPEDNHQISNWYLDGISQGTTQREFSTYVTKTHNIIVQFEQVIEEDEEEYFTINIGVSPSEAGYITGATTGSYKSGTPIMFEAVANDGYTFSSWGDGTTSTMRLITVSRDATYIAYFTTSSSGGSGGGILVNDDTITEGVQSSVNIPTAKTKVYLKFKPNYTGSYTFKSLNQDSLDPDGYICDAGKDVIDNYQNTDLGAFSVTYDKFIAGTIYYLAVSLYDGTGILNVEVVYNGTSETGITYKITAKDVDSGAISTLDDVGIYKYNSATASPDMSSYLGTTTTLTSSSGYQAIMRAAPGAAREITHIQMYVDNQLNSGVDADMLDIHTDGSWWSNQLTYIAGNNGQIQEVVVYFKGSSGGGSEETIEIITDEYVRVYQNGVNITNSSYIYQFNVGDQVRLVANNPGYTLNYWHNGDFMPGENTTTLEFIASADTAGTYQTTWTSGTSAYAMSPMMMRSAAPMTLTLEDDGIAAYDADNDNNTQRAKYKAVLCQYTTGSGWSILNETSNYIYHNDLYEDVKSKVIVISKEDVSNYKSIGVTIYKKVIDGNNIVYDNNLVVSNTSFTVFDLNDPILSNKTPSSAKEGQLWLDTSKHPYVLYIYQGGKWEYFNQQAGKTIYTTEPTTYTAGDIWILDRDQHGYGKGTMLTAIATVTVPGGFNITHWTDANPNTTNVISSIVESFSRDDNGIKIAQKIKYTSGKVESPFYVHIDSQRMGFHSVVDGVDDEVVHIGNSSAEILNATFKGDHGTKFENAASFYNQVNILNEKNDGTTSGFAFQTEDNGSFSLILVGN